MKTLLIIALTFTTTILMAQNTVTWVGGTPGKESDWNEPKNWSNHKVPNEFSDVFIKDVGTTTFNFPEIKNGLIEINSLQITSSGQLKINESAQLIVYGATEGLVKDNVIIQGSLIVLDEISEKEIDLKTVFSNN